MARKTSDIALLLGSRGRSRSRGGIGHRVIGFIDGLLGRSFKGRRRDERRGAAVSMWALLGAVLIAFGGGFLLGGQLAGAAQKDRNALSANVGGGGDPVSGRSPAFVGELDTRPMAAQAFIVAAYPELDDAAGRSRAASLAGWLREQGLGRARAYPWPSGNRTLWVVAVYFDGAAEQQEIRAALLALPVDVPDRIFVDLRNTEAGWPNAYPIR